MTKTARAMSKPVMSKPAIKTQAARACVIGAGIGGLALAIRLQAAGMPTMLIEAREQVGGGCWGTTRNGFRFEDGPSLIADPAPLRELWALAGHELSDHVNLLEVTQHRRFSWPDGSNLDLSGDEGALAREVARFAPADLAGFEQFLRWSEQARTEGCAALGETSLLAPLDAGRALPLIARYQGWRSAHGLVSHFIKHERLREALAFPALLGGGNPMRCSAFHLLDHQVPRGQAALWPQGGMSALAAAMAQLFEAMGGTVRLHDPALSIHTLGSRAHEVETQSGWRQHFDLVASNADLVHTYRDLLGECQRGADMARNLTAQRFAPGLFTVYLGLEGTWPGIPHSTVLMGPRFAGLFADIFEHGVLPRDFVMLLDHPSLTDPSLAPAGRSVLRAAIPVANLRRLPIDWESHGTLIENRIVAEIGRRLVPDIDDRIVTRFHRSPRDAMLDRNAFAGSAWGLEPGHLALRRPGPAIRDARIPNLYLVASGAQRGAGLPGAMASAKAAATLILENCP